MRRHGWVAWVRKPPKRVPVDQPRHHLEDLLLRASPRSDLCVWVPKFGAKGNVSRTLGFPMVHHDRCACRDGWTL